jgi:hypothetical protein
MMSASLAKLIPVDDQLRSLRTPVEQLRQEVGELRRENAELRFDVGYWKSMHARAVERSTKLHATAETLLFSGFWVSWRDWGLLATGLPRLLKCRSKNGVCGPEE